MFLNMHAVFYVKDGILQYARMTGEFNASSLSLVCVLFARVGVTLF